MYMKEKKIGNHVYGFNNSNGNESEKQKNIEIFGYFTKDALL